MLDDLFKYYIDNQSELVKKYNGKYIVINKDRQVTGAFDDEMQAYHDSVQKYGLGNFLIQLCTPGDEAYTQHFVTTRVRFA